MDFVMILILVIGSILFGLVQFTESVLDIRQRRRDQGDDPKAYL